MLFGFIGLLGTQLGDATFKANFSEAISDPLIGLCKLIAVAMLFISWFAR